jgi:hippurate hydrolase
VVKSDAGESVPVAHSCGHDIHMASWVGAATLLARSKDRWRGTLVFVGQPAEEVLQGAEAMVRDGLFTRFPKPDYVLAIHDTHLCPPGRSASSLARHPPLLTPLTSRSTARVGMGPRHLTIDPLLIAARTVVTLQTIVAREVNPFDPAVVTVGTFHAGTKRNVIADEAKIELTVRSYKPEVQKHLLESIERIAKAEAAAAGAPREPLVVVDAKEASEVVVNDPAMAARLASALRRAIGESQVVPIAPFSSSEDFGVYGRVAGVPSVMLRVGAIEPGEFAAAKDAGKTLPGPHSPLFAPDREPTIRTGVAALTVSVLESLGRPAQGH